MLTLRENDFTFVALNQCEVTLAGTAEKILLTQRYTGVRHLRVVESINKSPGQGISLNNSTDDGLFLFKPFAALANLSEQQDKAVCNRYTLIHKIIGTCKSHRHRWGQNTLFFVMKGFSFFFSLLVLVFASVLFVSFPFSFVAAVT